MSTALQSLLYLQPWAIDSRFIPLMLDIVERRIEQGVKIDPLSLKALGAYRPRMLSYIDVDTAPEDAPAGLEMLFDVDAAGVVQPAPAQGQKIGVINVMGPISQWPSMEMSGPASASTVSIGNTLDSLMGDATVKAIVMRFDSPGGGVYGVQELGDKINASKGQGKPIIAQVDSLAASAAYWLASQCDEIVITPSGQAGSIGVYTLHQDVSGAMDQAGVKPTFVSAGPYKVEGNQFQPLEGEALGAMQDTVNSYYNDFTSAVARGRGVTAQAVKDGYGQGRVLKAKESVKAGLADRVATMAQTLKRLGSTRGATVAQAAALDAAQVAAEEIAALDYLPIIDAGQIDQSIRVTRAEDGTFSISEPPKRMLFSKEILGDRSDICSIGAGKVLISASNGEAIYAIEGQTRDGEVVANLVSSSIVPLAPKLENSPTPAPAQDKEELARRRRLRNAHRNRLFA